MAAIHAANMAKLKREQVGTQITQFDDSKVMNHWRRNRKSAVDLLELPVAIDRQLEDQRIQQEFNRNPRFHIPTKVDKVRSEQIIAKQGSSRDVGIKANVVNKFVREASGIHTYALVAPVRLKGERIPIDPDPETNPFVKTYAKETKKKPHIVSFGHRPSSASRTFNPGTMKIRMKHNEVAKAPVEGKFEFGLPVGILGKLLHAPKIFQPEKEEANMLADPDNYNYDDASGAGSRDQSRGESRNDYNESAHNVHDPHDLFSAPPPSPGDVNYNNTNGNGAKAGAKTGSQKNGSIPIRKAANTGPMGDSFLGDSSLGAACVNDEHRGGYAQDIGLEGTQSWVSGSPGGGEGGRERSEGLFQGGIGNMDYMNIRIPGFPLGGSLEKPKRKKQPHPHDHLTPVSLILILYLCLFLCFVMLCL